MREYFYPNTSQERGLVQDFEYYYASLLRIASRQTTEEYKNKAEKIVKKHLSELLTRVGSFVAFFNYPEGKTVSTHTWSSFGYGATKPLSRKYLKAKNRTSGRETRGKSALPQTNLAPNLFNQQHRRLHTSYLERNPTPHEELFRQLKKPALRGKGLQDTLYTTFGGVTTIGYSVGKEIYKRGVTIRNNAPYITKNGRQERISWANAIDHDYQYLVKNLPEGVRSIGNGRYTYYGKGGLSLARLIQKYNIQTGESLTLFEDLLDAVDASSGGDPIARMLDGTGVYKDNGRGIGLLSLISKLASLGHPFFTPFIGSDLFSTERKSLFSKLERI